MSLTSSAMSELADSLRAMGTAFESQNRTVGTAVTALDHAVEAVEPLWNGPDPTDAMTAGRAFVDGVSDAADVIGDARLVVGDIARYVDGLSDRLAAAEATIQQVSWNRSIGLDAGDDDTAFDAARREREAVEEEWVYMAWFLTAAVNSTAERMGKIFALTAMGPPYPHPVPTGAAYAAFVVAYSGDSGIALATIDPTDEVGEAGDDIVDWLLGSQGGLYMFTVLESMRQGNIDDANGSLSEADLEAATFERARALWQQLNEENDLGLSDEEIDALARQTVAFAMILQQNGDEARDELNEAQPEDIEISEERIEQIREEGIANLGDEPGVGVCLEATGNVGPVAGETGTCFVSTDENLGQIVWAGGGQDLVGTVTGVETGGSLGAGTIVTNADEVGDLEGPALCFTGSGGAGVGGAGRSASASDGAEKVNGSGPAPTPFRAVRRSRRRVPTRPRRSCTRTSSGRTARRTSSAGRSKRSQRRMRRRGTGRKASRR